MKLRINVDGLLVVDKDNQSFAYITSRSARIGLLFNDATVRRSNDHGTAILDITSRCYLYGEGRTTRLQFNTRAV